MIRLAVFGNPVRKSLSPRIHGLFAQQFDMAVDYRAIETDAEGFAHAVRQLAEEGGLGCNITAPFKNLAYDLASAHSETARRAGAANTLLFDKHWFADNTDGRGLVFDLGRLGYAGVDGMNIAILGAGGAAAGVLAALLMAGPASITLANRTVSKAEELAAAHRDLGRIQACTPDQLAQAGPFDLLINATSQGHGGQAPELDCRCLAPGALLYDLNYGPAATPLKDYCEVQGVRYEDGLGMLVGQAAESFELWTGKAPARTRVLDQLREELSA